MPEDPDHLLLRAAQSCYDNTAVYKRFCRQRPVFADDVPYLSYADFHRAVSLQDCIHCSIDPYGVLPPFHRGFRRLPFTIVESNHDIDQRQERLAFAIEESHLVGDSRALIVTNEANGPFACDLSTGLGWEGIAASIFYHVGSNNELFFQLEAHQPDTVIWCLDLSLLPSLSDYTSSLLLAHNIGQPIPQHRGAIWLFSDEFNIVAARPEGRDTYGICEEQLLIETNEHGQQFMTSLTREIFPLVRYRIPHSFEVSQ